MEIDWAASYTFWHNLCLKGWSHFLVNPDDERNAKHLDKIKANSETANVLFEIPGDDWLSAEEISPCLNLFCMDINQIEPEQFCEIGGFKPEDVDIVCGGPPCQGFSTANSNRSMNDNRNTLPFRFLHYVHKIQPKVFLMENVPGMLTLGKKKNEKYGPFPQWIKETAEKFGYHCEWEIHNAMHYGVPQTRRRVVFVGIRQDLYDQGVRYTMPEKTHTYSYFDYIEKGLPLPENTEPYVTVAEAIGDLSDMELQAEQSADNLIYEDGRFFMPSKKGILMPAGYDGRGMEQLADSKHPGHYFHCPNCYKINIKVRKRCHYCSHSFSPIILLNDYTMAKAKTTVNDKAHFEYLPGIYTVIEDWNDTIWKKGKQLEMTEFDPRKKYYLWSHIGTGGTGGIPKEIFEKHFRPALEAAKVLEPKTKKQNKKIPDVTVVPINNDEVIVISRKTKSRSEYPTFPFVFSSGKGLTAYFSGLQGSEKNNPREIEIGTEIECFDWHEHNNSELSYYGCRIIKSNEYCQIPASIIHKWFPELKQHISRKPEVQPEPTTEALVAGIYHCEQPYVGFTGGIISADSEIILIEHWQDLKICLCEFPDDHKRLQIKEAEFRENWKLKIAGLHPTPSMPLPTLDTGVLWEAIPQMPVFIEENEAINPLTGTEILEPETAVVIVQPENSTPARPNAESYPGNKHSAGVPQRLINQIPVHDVRISGFGGKCAVMSYMVPAISNFVVDVNLDALREYWKAFPHVKTERADFLTWIKQFTFSKQTGPRYFIYLDPPYLFSSRRSGAIIYDHEMTDEQHADLIKWAIETTNMSNVMIAISHYPCPEYDQLLKHGWRKLTYQVATHMGTRDESLYMNYPEPAELHDYSFFGDNKITRQAFKRRVTKLVTKFQEIETQERAGLLRALAAQFNISTPPPFTNENEVAV